MRLHRVAFFVVCLLLAAQSPVKAKSPLVAGGLSVVLPGAGHIYTGQPSKGLTLLGIYAGAVGLAVATGPWTWEDASTGDFAEFNTGTPTTTKLIFYGAAVAAGGTLLYAVIDAVGSANRPQQGGLSLSPIFDLRATGIRAVLSF
jgi:hypothetical protein